MKNRTQSYAQLFAEVRENTDKSLLAIEAIEERIKAGISTIVWEARAAVLEPLREAESKLRNAQAAMDKAYRGFQHAEPYIRNK